MVLSANDSEIFDRALSISTELRYLAYYFSAKKATPLSSAVDPSVILNSVCIAFLLTGNILVGTLSRPAINIFFIEG